jgi:HAD superfamily hydrolase (TIGR01509 family)
MGASNKTIGSEFLPHMTLEAREATLAAKEAAYRAGIGRLEAISGAAALLDFADAKGLARADVTNAPRANVDVVLHAIGLHDRLPIRVIGAELARSKPDPLPYLTGLARTGAHAEHSVAFEDSLSGVRAAVAAGLAVVGLTTSLNAARLVSVGAVFAVADFTDPRIFELIETRIAHA